MTTSPTTVPLCDVCRAEEVVVDTEDGITSFYATCGRCWSIAANAPYCPLEHGGMSPRTTLVHDGLHLDGATAFYSCPRHGSHTATGWAMIGGARQARHDAHDTVRPWLLDVRLKPTGIAGSYDAEHPVRRAYARAYVDTARAIMAARS